MSSDRSRLPSTRIRQRLAAVLGAAACLLLAGGEAGAGPGDLLWVFQGIENINAMVWTPDVDGDQTPEVAVETYDAGASGHDLYLLSGGSSGAATVIWSTRPTGGPSDSGGYGDDCLNLGDDVSGDGMPDLLLGTAWGGRSAYGIDTMTGDVIWMFDTYVDTPPLPPRSGWVYSIHAIPDLNGDQVTDALFGAGSQNDGAYAVDGRTGDVLFRLDAVDAIVSSTALADVDGDGLAEAVFGGGDNEHRVLCVSGASQTTATLVWSRDVGDGTQHMAALADVNGDSRPEVLVGTWDYQVVCLSGADGQVLWTHDLGLGNVVMRVAPLDDVDGDTVPDVAVGSWDNATRVVSGADGVLIWSTPAGGDVWAVARADDVTGDGISDVVAGSFDTRVYLLDGVTGSELWSYPTGNRVMTVRGVGDLSGNGVPDVVAGTQMLSGSGGGRVYALEGNDPTAAAAAPALALRQRRRGIELSWPTDRVAPGTAFNVYRRRLGASREAGPDRDGAARARRRRDLKVAVSTSGLPAREKLAMILELTADDSFERLNAEPVQPDGPIGRYLDVTARAREVYEYRLGYVEPGVAVELFLPPVVVEARSGGLGSALTIQSAGPAGRPGGFRVTLPARLTGDYRVALYGVDGRLVRVLGAGRLPEEDGDLEIVWDGRDRRGHPLATGVYVARVVAGGERAVSKVVWIR